MIWGLMVPLLSQKGLIFIYLGQGLSQKVGFLLIFEAILRAGLFEKNVGSLNKNSIFVFVFGFVVFSQFCTNIIRKVSFLQISPYLTLNYANLKKKLVFLVN